LFGQGEYAVAARANGQSWFVHRGERPGCALGLRVDEVADRAAVTENLD
jgi:hypothetical protein